MGREGGSGGGGGGGKPKGGKVVTDSRFAAVHSDPRFQRFPKAKAKVEIDERFAGEHPPPLPAEQRLRRSCWVLRVL